MITLQETIYRPPTEARSALLELSVGCSYGKCAFCRLADGRTPLQIIPRKVLGANLLEMVCQGETATRMFLTGENALAFKTSHLLETFQFVRGHLPDVAEFAMYGRADDVARKTDAQLADLRAGGLDTVYVGVESGNAEILRRCDKGETPEEIVEQLRRLDAAGIRYGLSSILGLGGTEMWREHALDTAALYNAVHPASIRVMTLTPMKGSPLAAAVERGEFVVPPTRMILREELLLLETLRRDGACRFVANHVSNAVPFVGNLPDERERIVGLLRDALAKEDGGAAQEPLNTW